MRRAVLRLASPTICPRSLMSRAPLRRPPSVPRSVILPSCQMNAWPRIGFAVRLPPITWPRLLIARTLLDAPPSVPSCVFFPSCQRNAPPPTIWPCSLMSTAAPGPMSVITQCARVALTTRPRSRGAPRALRAAGKTYASAASESSLPPCAAQCIRGVADSAYRNDEPVFRPRGVAEPPRKLGDHARPGGVGRPDRRSLIRGVIRRRRKQAANPHQPLQRLT
jgi:hypothetical protein